LLRLARRASTDNTTKMKINQLDTILPGFAALDLGATSIHAATADTPVAVFGTTTEAAVYGTRGGRRMGEPAELRRLERVAHRPRRAPRGFRGHGRLLEFRCTTSSERAGFELMLFHGAHARNLPGKKSDFSDCQWHAVLFSHGLLRACFIPPQEVRALRAYARLREDHLGAGGDVRGSHAAGL